MTSIINSRHNYVKPKILLEKKSDPSCQSDCGKCLKKKCCCVKSDLFVAKTLVSVYRQLSLDTPGLYIKLVISYDITLINESCCKISNVGIQDTLFNLISSLQVLLGLRIVSCCDSLIVRPIDDIFERQCPQLLDTANSFIPPCSACRVIVTVILHGFPENPSAEIRQLMNTITVTGKIDSPPHCGCCQKSDTIEPIVKKSILWTEENPIILAAHNV